MALHGSVRSRAHVWRGRVIACSLIMLVNAARADDLWQALTGGRPDLYLRYRFENVDDGQAPALKDAYASTLRTAIGCNTGLYHDPRNTTTDQFKQAFDLTKFWARVKVKF